MLIGYIDLLTIANRGKHAVGNLYGCVASDENDLIGRDESQSRCFAATIGSHAATKRNGKKDRYSSMPHDDICRKG